MQPCTSYCPPTQVTARKLGNKRVSGAALGAEALRAPGLAVASTPDGLVAVGVAAEPVALRHLRIGQDRGGRDRPAECAGWSTTPAPSRPRVLPDFDEPVRRRSAVEPRASSRRSASRRRRDTPLRPARVPCRRRRSSRRRRFRCIPVRCTSSRLPPLLRRAAADSRRRLGSRRADRTAAGTAGRMRSDRTTTGPGPRRARVVPPWPAYAVSRPLSSVRRSSRPCASASSCRTTSSAAVDPSLQRSQARRDPVW